MSMVQLVSYGFTTVENPLSDGGIFSAAGSGFQNCRVPSSGVAEPTNTSHAALAAWTAAIGAPSGAWPADQYSEVTLLTNTTSGIIIPVVRQSGSANTCYQLNMGAGLGGAAATGTLFATVAGTSHSLATTSSQSWVSGDVLRLSVTGNVITVTRNGTSILSFTDNTWNASVTGGSPGFEFFNTSAITSSQISLFAAGANQCATPTFSPNGGSFGPAQTVTITGTTSSTIYYTTDGTTPTESSSSVASGGTVSISATATLKAISSLTNNADSAVGSASFTINGAVATSTFSPVAGSYSSTQSVTLANTNSGLTGFAQYYTTDGTTPTTGSTLYSGAISVSASETIKVLAVATNYSNSSIASAAYTITGGGGSGVGTVMTGAAIGIKPVNSSGYDLPITSPTVTSHLGLPIPVCFCDPNGNEYTVTGATKGNFVKGALPVVLCDPNGRPIVPPIVLTSNGNSISITATLTGVKLGQPTPVMLTDQNGFLYTLSGFSYGVGAQRPVPVCMCDIHGSVITMTIAT